MSLAFSTVPRLLLGSGISKTLGSILNANGHKHPLIVTDKHLLSLGLLQPALDNLKDMGINYTLFSGVNPDPKEKDVVDALTVVGTCSCDSVVGFGGGSSLDVSKILSYIIKLQQTTTHNNTGETPNFNSMYGVANL